MAKRRRRDGQGPFWGDCIGPNPTDRAKNGTKRSLIVDQDGGPLGATIAGANVHDAKLLKDTIQAIVVERPEPTAAGPQNLCLDKGYDNPTGQQAVAVCNYTPHIRRIGEDVAAAKKKSKRHKPRRWVVERTMSWLSKCRAILVRYDKNSYNYLGLIELACALLWFRRLHRIGSD
jgi:putative transposase